MAFPVGWQRRCALVVDGSMVVGSGTHANFPVLLTPENLPSEMLDKDGPYPAQLGGGDIRFTSDTAGTAKLPCHVVDFAPHNTPASAKALIYVAVDLPAGTNKTIYVWYRCETKKRQPKFDASPDADGFKGSDHVWANYEAMFQLGGFGGVRNLKQGNAAKNLGRYGRWAPKKYTIAARSTGNKYIAFPKLALVGDRLYCGVREAAEHIVTPSSELRFYYSDDMGRTWTNDANLTLSSAANTDLREANLLLDSQGTLWLFYAVANYPETTRAIYCRKSAAPYTSWGAAVLMTPAMTRTELGTKPIQMASGRIVVPAYDINGSNATWPFVLWSDDFGATWATDFITADGAAPGSYDQYNETAIAENPALPGNLIAISRRNGYFTQYKSYSTDGGQTWGAYASDAVLAIDSGGGNEPDMPELLVTSDGQLLVAYAKNRWSPDFRIRASTDFGATWGTPYASAWANSFDTTIKPDGFQHIGGYCSMVELLPGMVAVAYYFDDQGYTGEARPSCTHITKVEDGELNYWTDTQFQTGGVVDKAFDFDTERSQLGAGSVSFFNAVHNGAAFTISGWLKMDVLGDRAHAIIGSSAASADKGFSLLYENRSVVGSPGGLRLIKSSGSALIDQTTGSISADTSPHRIGVFCSAGGVPTFIKDTVTYAGSAAITGTAGDATLPTRFGGVSITAGGPDIAALRLDGWMGMWGLSTVNLGADYEATRYHSENAPASFVVEQAPESFDVTVVASGTGACVVAGTGAAVCTMGLAVVAAGAGACVATGTAAVSVTVDAGGGADPSTYATQQDLIDRFGAPELAQLTDPAAGTTINADTIARALGDAAAEIDTRLAARYLLPLASVPEVLRRVACDLARYYLWDVRASDQVRNRYRDAIALLDKIVNGSIVLTAAAPLPPASGAVAVAVQAPDRLFGTDLLDQFTRIG